MSDTALNKIVQFGTSTDRAAFTPTPASGSKVLYLWYETDNAPDTYAWNGSAWVKINASGSGITTLTSDVTAGPGSGSQAATIAANAVTYAKMQDISATARILGRKTSGSGDTEECTLSQILDFLGSAAQGDILFRGSSGWQYLAPGTSGNFLKTNGAGADPSWASAGGGGGGGWTLVASQAMSGNTSFDFTGLSAYSDLRVTFEGVGYNNSAQPTIRVSTDNGSTFLSSSGDYNAVNGDGTLTADVYIRAMVTNRFGSVYAEALIEGFNMANAAWARCTPSLSVEGGALQYLPGTTARNAIRVMNSSVGAYNAGTVTVYGR